MRRNLTIGVAISASLSLMMMMNLAKFDENFLNIFTKKRIIIEHKKVLKFKYLSRV